MFSSKIIVLLRCVLVLSFGMVDKHPRCLGHYISYGLFMETQTPSNAHSIGPIRTQMMDSFTKLSG